MTIAPLLQFLTSPSGMLIYQVLVFLGFFTTAGLVWTEWRRAQSSEVRPQWIALGGVMIVRLVNVLLAMAGVGEGAALGAIAGPWIYASEPLSVFLVAWALNRRILGRTRRSSLTIACGTGIWFVILLAVIGLRSLVGTGVWSLVLWYALAALVSLVGGGLLLTRRATARTPAPYIFFLLSAGSILGILASSRIGPVVPNGEGWSRLSYLVGYPLFALALYSSVLAEVTNYRDELRSLSYKALGQTQELLSLIEAAGLISRGATGLREMLEEVLQSVAVALHANAALILLPHREMRGILRVAARYQVLIRKSQRPREIRLDAYPQLSAALRARDQVVLGERAVSSKARKLASLLGDQETRAILIQPLLHREQCLGVLIASLEEDRRAFVEEHQQLSETLGSQMAGAIENVRLYRSLDSKARELQRLLRRRESELRRESAILESMAEGVLVSDSRGRFVMMNRAAEEILDVGRGEMIGRTVPEVMADGALQGPLASGMLMTTGDTYETTFNLNERYVRVHAAPVLMKDGTWQGVVSVLQDITREQLAEEAKREFIASISHELRTPLTAIKGYAEVMLNGMVGDVPSVFTQFLRSIRDNTTRMTTLTNNIISVAEIERGRLGLNYQTLELDELIRSSVGRHMERVEERGQTLTVTIDEDLPTIEGDPNRLRVILDNLISNAIKYTHNGGAIAVGAEPIYGPMGKSTFVTIWVKDNGVGIPTDQHVRIWDRFYRVENSLSVDAGGLGIGLAITKALTEAHGGRVWVDSTLGEGSTFTVLLPIRRSQRIEGDMLDQLIARHRAAVERAVEEIRPPREEASTADVPEAAASSSRFISDAEDEGSPVEADDADAPGLDDWTPPEPPSWL